MDNNYIQYEGELDIKRVVVACLRKWRMILIAMLVVALLMGGANVVSQLTQTEPLEESVPAETGVVSEVEAGFSISVVIARTVLGAILGMVAVCVFELCKECFLVIFGKNVRSMKGLCEQLNIPIVASIHVPVGSKNLKNTTKFDRIIDRWDGANRKVDMRRVYALAAAKICVIAGTKKQVLVIGTVDEAKLNEVADHLTQSGVADGFSFIPVAKVLQNPKSMLKVKDQSIVLVHQEEGSRKTAVLPLLEFLAQSRAAVVGAILL